MCFISVCIVRLITKYSLVWYIFLSPPKGAGKRNWKEIVLMSLFFLRVLKWFFFLQLFTGQYCELFARVKVLWKCFISKVVFSMRQLLGFFSVLVMLVYQNTEVFRTFANSTSKQNFPAGCKWAHFPKYLSWIQLKLMKR